MFLLMGSSHIFLHTEVALKLGWIGTVTAFLASEVGGMREIP